MSQKENFDFESLNTKRLLSQRSTGIPSLPFSNIRRRFEKNSDDQKTQSLNEKLDQVLVNVQDLKRDVAGLKRQLDGQEKRFSNLISFNNENLEKKVNVISTKVNYLESNIGTINSNFSQQMIYEAKEQLNLDLNIPLIYNGQDLLSVPFDSNDIASYGIGLLDILFYPEEQSIAMVESDENTINSLDRKKIDQIKVCYLKKLNSTEAFKKNWPIIKKAIREKCLYTRKIVRDYSNLDAKN
ncbi:hypothetical protein BpHYR1_021746 [Brachionus plicatilis]|uniref:Uncharacterized protein n=1 Tax=Brachionus plicatilis TaxID=10195 RepID=A0A3M7T1Y3_BRAPC|nr:hypothetical protein BpHYR1_021746 [Brachionus plicatilis]